MSEERDLAQPYRQALGDSDPVEVMRASPNRLNRILGALSPEAIEHKPGAHKWSVREILCHLADCEIAWAWRLRLIYGADNPTVQPFEQDPWARAYHGVEYTTEAARGTWTTLRRWNLALIGDLSEADKHRPAVHPEIGPITLWTIVEIAAGHDLHHLTALERLAAETPAR